MMEILQRQPIRGQWIERLLLKWHTRFDYRLGNPKTIKTDIHSFPA